jgi:hypothetical protein
LQNATSTKPRTKIHLNKLYRGGDTYNKSHHDTFLRVASFYAEARTRLNESPISCSNPDPDSRKNMRWSLLCEFCADFEQICERSLKQDLVMESAAIELLRELAGFGKADLPDGLRYKTIQRLGSALTPMDPKRYFRTFKTRRETRGE